MAINCMVILAHQDDECLSTGLYIQSRVAKSMDVHVLTVFGRNYDYGQGDQYVEENNSAYEQSCDLLKVRDRDFLCLLEGEPTSQSYYRVLRKIEQALKKYNPVEVVIHDDQDRNQDHRWLSDVCKIALRPWAFPDIKRVLMCQSPDGLPKDVNHYVRGTEKRWQTQVLAVESYARELRTGVHPRSLATLNNWQRVLGSYCDSERAEPFRTYFSKD